MMDIQLPHHFLVTNHTDFVTQGSTFVVVKGMKEDGVMYIEKALTAGATTIVIEQDVELSHELSLKIQEKQAQLVRVTSSRKALAELSAQAYGFPSRSLKIIGITGTKGKTTTAFLIEHMLKSAGYKTALLSTVENRILTTKFPASLTTAQPDYLHAFFSTALKAGVEYVVMEVAAQALTLHRVATLEFDAVIFTNFSAEHAEFYKDQDEYFKAKCLLINQLAPAGKLILNADDQAVAQLSILHKNVVSFSTQKEASLTAYIEKNTTVLTMNVNTQKAQYAIQAPALLGEFSALNSLAAIAVAEHYAIKTSAIAQAFASFEGVPGRLQRINLPNGAVAFIDNAHTASSFQALLSTLRPLSSHIITVFGAGGDRDATKRPHMGALASQYSDAVFLTTDNPRSEDPQDITNQIYNGIDQSLKSKVSIELDREKAIKAAYALSKPHSFILLLGKGPVEYQHVKDVKIPFSEAAILRSL